MSCLRIAQFQRKMFICFVSMLFLLASSNSHAAAREILQIGKLRPQSFMNVISHSSNLYIKGNGIKGAVISLRLRGEKNKKYSFVINSRGRFQQRVKLASGMNKIEMRTVGQSQSAIQIAVAYMPMQQERSFEGSLTRGLEPFERLFPNSTAYSVDAAARKGADHISQSMAEIEGQARFSDRISLGEVFFGQFVDHDLDRIQSKGQGPSSNPVNPINIRTPALDLDSVYAGGPLGSASLYDQDGLRFLLGKNGTDLLRDASGKAQIGDDRNDENGFIAAVHLAFQRYHNHLIDKMLHGLSAQQLSPEQRAMIFHGVRNIVIGRYQGMVANQLSVAFSGLAVPETIEPINNIPIEFAGAVYRLGHTLVPQRVKIDQSGDTFSPVDPKLRGNAAAIDLNVLFGAGAQPASEFDDKIAQVMRELLIPLSPSDPSQGEMIGGQSPNLGNGKIINGVLHLDLIETNLLRGRELKLPSGEECFARINNLPYQPSVHGNTDLFAYILQESNGLGYLGRVGSYVYNRTIGGVLAADPYRYYNSEHFTQAEIKDFREFTMEKMLAELGDL